MKPEYVPKTGQTGTLTWDAFCTKPNANRREVCVSVIC